MFGRRNSPRYESGKPLKRIRKRKLMTFAFIALVGYIVYRSVFGSSVVETPPPVERIRSEYNRQIDQIKSNIRIKGKALERIDVITDQRQKGDTEKQKHSHKNKVEVDKAAQERELIVIEDTENSNDTKKARLNVTDTKTKNTSEHRVPVANNTTSHVKEHVNKSVNATLQKHTRKTNVSENLNSNKLKNGTRFKSNDTGDVIQPPKELTELNKSKHEFPSTSSGITLYQDDGTDSDSECVPLRVRGGTDRNGIVVNKTTTNICIHNVTEDRFVSGVLKDWGTWEQSDLDGMGAVLRNHSDMTLIDMGCNIGAYSLYGAALGNKVIAIDPFRKHLKLLNKSLKLNKQEHAVTVLWNAVSDQHLKVNLSQTQDRNLGSVNIVIRNPTRHVSDYSVQTITLDDIADKFKLNATKVFLKMDIEASEYNALMGGVNFFKQANVCIVLMEFVSYKMNTKGEEILKFMSSFGLYPYPDLRLQYRLDVKGVPLKNYPLNAVFAKDSVECIR